MRDDHDSKQRVDTLPGTAYSNEYDDLGRFTHACLLLLLLLRPGAGVLSDGHRLNSTIPRRKTQTHPQTLPVGLLFFRQQHSSKR
jgi:hypothetical protein